MDSKQIATAAMAQGAAHAERCCYGKRGYGSERAATKCLHRMQAQQSERPGYNLGVYECPACGDWHVGNMRALA
jgi:hypothetical protein